MRRINFPALLFREIISSHLDMMVSTRRTKRSAPLVIDLELEAKRPRIESDIEKQLLSHWKQSFHAEITIMEDTISNLLFKVKKKEEEIKSKESEVITASNSHAEKIQEMERENSMLVKENQSLKHKIQELENCKLENLVLLEKNEDLQQALKSEQANRISERKKMNFVETENLNQREKIKSLEVRLKDKKNKNILEAKEKMEKYLKQIADLEDVNKTQSMCISAKELENQSLKDCLKEMEEKKDEEIDYLAQARDELEKDLEQINAKLEITRAAMTEKEEERSEQEKEDRILKLEEEKKSWTAEKEKIRNQLSRLKDMKNNEILRLKEQCETFAEYEGENLKTIYRLESIIFNRKAEQEHQMVMATSESEQKTVVETENKISETLAPVKRPRGRPRKNIASVEKDLKALLFEDRKTTIQ